MAHLDFQLCVGSYSSYFFTAAGAGSILALEKVVIRWGIYPHYVYQYYQGLFLLETQFSVIPQSSLGRFSQEESEKDQINSSSFS